jgi:hypothetical protein
MPLRVADVAQNARTEAGRGEAQQTQGAQAWRCIDGSAETQHFSDGGALGRRSSDARRALRRLGAAAMILWLKCVSTALRASGSGTGRDFCKISGTIVRKFHQARAASA